MQVSLKPLPKQTVAFLELPAEIRNRIYHYALVSDETRNVQEACTTRRGRNNGSWKALLAEECLQKPALLRTCTTVRNEATAIFYVLNNFHGVICPGGSDLASACTLAWLKAIGSVDRKLMSEIKITLIRPEGSLEPARQIEKVLTKNGMPVLADSNAVKSSKRCEKGYLTEFTTTFHLI